MIIASIVVAAGMGKRYGSRKQFEMLAGKPVYQHSLDVLKRHSHVAVLVVPHDEVSSLRNKHSDIRIVAGGRERMHSVYNGLVSIKETKCDIVMIHDAARPVISERLIENLIDTASKEKSAVPIIKIVETVKQIDGEKIVSTLDRSKLATAQTPQAFDYNMLMAAYEAAIASGTIFTDEAAVWEQQYGSANTVEGDRKNIKITTKEDLELIKCLLG